MVAAGRGADGAAAELQVIHLPLDESSGDPFQGWIVERTVALIGELRELVLADSDRVIRIAIVVTAAAQDDDWRAAAADGLCEAVRGVVGSLTLEQGPRLRLNAVIAEAAEHDEVRETLVFLSSAEADFVAGSTFDLRHAQS